MHVVRNKFFAVVLLLVFGAMLCSPLLLAVSEDAADPCGMGCIGVCCCLPDQPAAENCGAGDALALIPSWVNCASLKISPASAVSFNLFLKPRFAIAPPPFAEFIFHSYNPPIFTPVVFPPPETPPWHG